MEKKPYRPFQISCGLRQGYDVSNKVHDSSDALAIIQRWIERRMRDGKKIVAGTFLEGKFVYPWVDGQEFSSRHEPAFHYKGMVREDASDEEAIEMLTDLAKELARALHQKRVHVVFCTDYFLLETK